MPEDAAPTSERETPVDTKIATTAPDDKAAEEEREAPGPEAPIEKGEPHPWSEDAFDPSTPAPVDQGVLDRARRFLDRAQRAQGFLETTRPVDLTTRDLVDFLRLLVVPTLEPAAESDPLLWLAVGELRTLVVKLEGLDTHPNRREETKRAEQEFIGRAPKRATLKFKDGEAFVDLGKIAAPVKDRTYADELTDLFMANDEDTKFSDVEKRVVAWAERTKAKLPKLGIDLAKVHRQLEHYRRDKALKATREDAQEFAVFFMSKVGMGSARGFIRGAEAQANSRARKSFADEVACLLVVDEPQGRFKVADVAHDLAALVARELAQDAKPTSLTAKLRQLDVEKFCAHAEEPLKSSKEEVWPFARTLFVDAGMGEDDAASLLRPPRDRVVKPKKPRG